LYRELSIYGLFYGVFDFAGVGESSDPELRENHVAVHLDVKNAAASLDEIDLRAELPLDIGRQPGGPGQVVSLDAVFDGDVHGTLRVFFTVRRIPWSSRGEGGRIRNSEFGIRKTDPGRSGGDGPQKNAAGSFYGLLALRDQIRERERPPANGWLPTACTEDHCGPIQILYNHVLVELCRNPVRMARPKAQRWRSEVRTQHGDV